MKVVLKQPNKKPMRATAFFAVASPGPMTDLGDAVINLNLAHSTKDAKTYDAVMEHLKARMLHEEALKVSVSVGSYFEETKGSLFRRKPVECLPMDGYPYMVDGISAGIYMTIDEVCKLLYAEEILSEKMQSELRLVIVYEQLTGSDNIKGIEFLTVSISDIYLNNQRDNQQRNIQSQQSENNDEDLEFDTEFNGQSDNRESQTNQVDNEYDQQIERYGSQEPVRRQQPVREQQPAPRQPGRMMSNAGYSRPVASQTVNRSTNNGNNGNDHWTSSTSNDVFDIDAEIPDELDFDTDDEIDIQDV